MIVLPTDGNYDFFCLSVLPSGMERRFLNCLVGGSLLRAMDEYGVSGMPAGTVGSLPVAPLAAFPAEGVMFLTPPNNKNQLYPEISTDPGSPADNLDGGLDHDHLDILVGVAKVLGSYQTIKDWCVGLGGTWEALPTRPV